MAVEIVTAAVSGVAYSGLVEGIKVTPNWRFVRVSLIELNC